jgi:hypothetical protein
MVDIMTCILFIIQDMQEGDVLCGRFGPHTPQIQRHCCSCTVEFNLSDDPDAAACRYLFAFERRPISHSYNEILRKAYAQHQLPNIFKTVPLADPQRGITLLVLKNVPATKKAALDALAVYFH